MSQIEKKDIKLNSHIKYDRHTDEWDACLSDPERRRVALTWLHQSNTFDSWRHDRMYELVKELVKVDQESTWLTVGDGRYGTDAHAILKMGAKNVYCTDISDTLLEIGSREGFINEYSAQNAESLTFEDDQFDFVFCKEALHHFPRPYTALHEMFRVARVAVILIEPRDSNIDTGKLNWIIRCLKRLVGKKTAAHSFESVGNYIYSLSEREIEKFLLGMHRRFVAFNGLNDVYTPGVEFIELSTKDSRERSVLRVLKAKLNVLDLLTALGIRETSLIATVLFKSQPAPVLIDALEKKGWKLKELPRNPYS